METVDPAHRLRAAENFPDKPILHALRAKLSRVRHRDSCDSVAKIAVCLWNCLYTVETINDGYGLSQQDETITDNSRVGGLSYRRYDN